MKSPNFEERLMKRTDIVHRFTVPCRGSRTVSTDCNLLLRRRAFTLLEILIVVVILSIAALTAIPMMSSAGSIQVRSGANKIAADLEYAKSMAISMGQNYYVVFDKNNDSYRIEDQSRNVVTHPVKKGFGYIVDMTDENLGQVDITDANFGGNSEVCFDCLGSPDFGGTISLQGGGMNLTVSVEPVTGYISIN